MKFKLLFIFCILILNSIVVSSSNSSSEVEYSNYPVPQKTDKLLFYLQRTHNKNTIVYEANYLADGKLNPSEPVHVSWIRYEEGGSKAELSYIQKHAFGFSFHITDRAKESYTLNFNNFKKKDIYLQKSGDKYVAYMIINSKLSELRKLFIKSENNSLGFPIVVKYIDVFGVDYINGNNVSERIIP